MDKQTWFEKIIAVHLQVTDAVSHSVRIKSDRYFLWEEDDENAFAADGKHAERAVPGTTDLFTRQEFDPWKDEFEAALNACPFVAWRYNSHQYEEETGLHHYEWRWEVF